MYTPTGRSGQVGSGLDSFEFGPPNRSDFEQEALLYRDMGWSVFPLHKKKPAVRFWRSLKKDEGAANADGHKGKSGRVLVKGWKSFQTARPTDRQLHQMFHPDYYVPIDGLGVVLGRVSGGLYARDFDTREGYARWAAANPALARALPTVRTGRGYHVYARLPAGHPPVYKTWAESHLKGELLGDGLHYVVLPPSKHPDGRYYEWANRRPFSREDVPVLDPVRAGFLCREQIPSGNSQSSNGTEPVKTRTRPAGEAAPNNNPSSVTQEVARVSLGGGPVPLEVTEREAVLKCVPAEAGQRNACLWQLARTLKAVPHLADASDADLYSLVEFWFEAAVRVIDTKSLKGCWNDFRRQWKEVRVPLGQGLDAAVAKALERPFPPEADRFEKLVDKRLVAVCADLQRHAGGEPFFLSCRTAQRLCGYKSHMTANRRLNDLVEDGMLVLVERGRPAEKLRRASRYRWQGQTVVAPNPVARTTCDDEGARLAV
jgi:hypothetical protein